MPSELHPHPALKVQGRFLFPCVGHSGAPVDNRAWTACMRGGSLALPSRRLDPPGDAADVNIAARARDAADNVGGTREDGVHGLMLTLQLHSVRPAAVEHEGLVRVGYTGRRHPRLAVRCGDRARSLRQRLRHQGHSADREASQGSGETCCPRGANVRRTVTWRAARRRPNIPVLFPPNHTTSTELSRVKANFVFSDGPTFLFPPRPTVRDSRDGGGAGPGAGTAGAPFCGRVCGHFAGTGAHSWARCGAWSRRPRRQAAATPTGKLRPLRAGPCGARPCSWQRFSSVCGHRGPSQRSTRTKFSPWTTGSFWTTSFTTAVARAR